MNIRPIMPTVKTNRTLRRHHGDNSRESDSLFCIPAPPDFIYTMFSLSPLNTLDRASRNGLLDAFFVSSLRKDDFRLLGSLIESKHIRTQFNAAFTPDALLGFNINDFAHEMFPFNWPIIVYQKFSCTESTKGVRELISLPSLPHGYSRHNV